MLRLRYLKITNFSLFTYCSKRLHNFCVIHSQIVETLNKLVTLNMGKAHEDSPLKFIELIQLLRVARYESIEALWDQYKARSDYR